MQILTPKVDFVARICNDGGAPVLEAVQAIDSSGSWNIIRQNFAHTYPSPNEFPESLAPLFLVRTSLTNNNFGTILATNEQGKTRVSRCWPSRQWPVQQCWQLKIKENVLDEVLGEPSKGLWGDRKGERTLWLSPTHAVNLDAASRYTLAQVVREHARSFDI
jgi:hypothetical protein